MGMEEKAPEPDTSVENMMEKSWITPAVQCKWISAGAQCCVVF